MEYREPQMSLASRPDERRREEARIARASQARPLVEPETTQVFHGDSIFNRVTVPNNQLDDFSKSIMAVLGPWHNVLGGPSINGQRPTRTPEVSSNGYIGGTEKTSSVDADELSNVTVARPSASKSGHHQQQQQLQQPSHKHSSSSSAAVRPHSNLSTGGDSKRPLTLPLPQQTLTSSSLSSNTSSKPVKPSVLTPVESNLSSSSSSSVTISKNVNPTVLTHVESNISLSSSSSSSSITLSKSVKPSVLTPVEVSLSLSTSSSLPSSVVSSSSSPATSAHSPVKPAISKDKHTVPKEHDVSKDMKQRSQAWTPPAPSSTVKQKSLSTSLISPKKDANHHQHLPPNLYNSSKSRLVSSAQPLTSSGATDEPSQQVSPRPSQSPAPPSALPSVTNKDHVSNNNNPITTTTISSSSPTLHTTVTFSTSTTSSSVKSSPSISSSSSSTSHTQPPAQQKLETSPPSRPRSSFSNRTHVTPTPRPRSTTPTKTKPHPLNGITSQYPSGAPITAMASSAELSSSKTNIATTTKTASISQSPSMAKSKSLTLWIPTNERKKPETKSDLIDILKEMTDLHAPLTAIETPQKAEGEFPFYTAGPSGEKPIVKISQELMSDSLKEPSKKTAERESDIVKDNISIKKEEKTQKEVKASMPALASTPLLNSVDSSKEIKIESKPGVEIKPQKAIQEKFSDGTAIEESAETRRYISSTSISQTPRYKSIGKAISDENSILMRDLDLSEDSDVEPTSEEINISEHQSKKGKVIASTADVILPKRDVPHMSSRSSTSSNSDSSSESDDEDENENSDGKKERVKKMDAELKKSSERRLSSSSSCSSSNSELVTDEEDNEEEGDEERKGAGNKKVEDMEDIKTNDVERGEKTPSPGNKQGAIAPVPLGTPTTIAQEETNLSWGLGHFMQPKRSSPASVSPVMSTSPPTPQPALTSVQQKDNTLSHTADQNRPGTLRNIARPKKNVSDTAADNNKKIVSKEIHLNSHSTAVVLKLADPTRKELVSSRHNSSSITNSRKERKKPSSPVSGTNPGKLKTPSPLTKTKTLQPGSSSSSNDEIDVVSYTPDEKIQQRLMSSSDKTLTSKRGILELSKIIFKEALSESSDDDSKVSQPKDKNAEINNTKRYKITGAFGEHTASMPLLPTVTSNVSSAASPLGASAKSSKKDSSVAMDHLEAISKPPNLLSRLNQSYSLPPVASTKPLPPFQASFSPLHSSTTMMPPYVTLTRNADGSSRPKIMVQIPQSLLSKTVLNWIQNERERRNKSKKDAKVSESSKNDSSPDILRKSRLPTSDKTSSQHSSGGLREDDPHRITPRNGEQSASSPAAHSVSSKVLKSGKHKSRESGSIGFDTGTVSSPLHKMLQNSKSARKETQSSSSSSSSSLSEHTSTSLPTKSSSSVDIPTAAAANLTATTWSQLKTAHVTSPSPKVTTSNVSGTSTVTNPNFIEDKDINADESKSNKSKQFKRKLDSVDDVSVKRSKCEPVIDKGSNAVPATIGKRRDSGNSTSSKGSNHQSSLSKKPRHTSANSKTDISSNSSNSSNNSVDKANVHLTNGPENSNLPFNLYVNGSTTSSSNGVVNSRAQSSSSSSSTLPVNLPPPSPIETQLHSTKHYLARATEHKHHADKLKDKLAKYEPYLRSGLSFYLACYSMELSKREQNTSYSMYNDTSNLLQYVIRMRANSSSNPESSDKERKLVVLIIRLQAYLNHRMYRLRKAEVSKFKKVIESEQTKYQTSTTSGTTSSSTNVNAAVGSSKPQAPSPHQTNWNKNSTGTPSPMSPTPSPAGSVSSQGSCELVTAKIQNGINSASSTPLTSPSPGMVSVHQRVHAVTQKYFILTSHMVKALELWDQADAESRGFEDFFTVLDNACGPLSFHSDPPVVVRYMKHALRLLL